MMVDFAIAAERDEQPVAGTVDQKGGAAAFPPHHDDDDGGAVGRRAADAGHRYGSGNPSTDLGYAMVGGLVVSQALTLFTTPIVYLYLDKLSNAFSNWGRSSKDDAHDGSEHGAVKEAAE